MSAEPPMRIPITRPLLDEAECEAARAAIMSGWVTQGPEVARFESEFAAFAGAAHACAVSSCTTALHLALLAAGVEPGDEVVTVSHSYIATANAVRYCGAVPVFVDIDPATYNMDPAAVEQAITARTAAILCVHQAGMPCDLDALLRVSRAAGLPLIEDAACAIGSEVRCGGGWARIGVPHGDIACFSFHPRKVITTGDGGMLTTANPEYDQRFRRLRQHAMSVPDTTRHGAASVIFEEYPELGYNYRMTDIQAAVGRAQLKRLPEILERRRRIAARYGELLAGVDAVTAPHEPDWARSNWQSYLVRLDEGYDQRGVMQHMLERGVATRRGIMCAHRERACAGIAIRHPLVHSEGAQDRAIILPLFPQMTEAEQDYVVAALRDACAAAR